MGKKKTSRAEVLAKEDEAALAEQEAEDAELRAEIRALGGNPSDLTDADFAAGSLSLNTVEHPGSSTSGPTSSTYDKAGLESKLDDIYLDLPFRQKLAVVSSLSLNNVLMKEEVHDDLKRETAFYQQAQASVAIARQTLDRQKVPYLRPDDYYAEMVKSDGHMQRIRDSLLFEQKKMAAFEQRKKNQEQKKFGKQLQHEKQVAKAAEKRATLDAIKQIRKRRGQNDESGEMESNNGQQFDIQLERETNAAQKRQQDGGWVYDRKEKGKSGGSIRGASDGGFQKSAKRQFKDSKFGYGDGGRKGGRSKRNNEQINDAGNYGRRSYNRGGGNARGSNGSKGSKGGQRPGKKRRLNNRS
jgi:rRNA-processing protein EBP2